MKLMYEAWTVWCEEKMDMIGQFYTPEEAITAARAYAAIHGYENGSQRYEVIVTGWEDA